MQVTKEKAGPCTYKFRIEIDTDAVDKAFRRAWRELAEITSVPGFRPGKAPRPILERYVERDRLLQRVTRLLASPALAEALEQEHTVPWLEPDLKFGDLVEGQPWAFEATIAVAPVVSLADPTTISVTRRHLTADDSDIERSLQTLRESNAVAEPVEGRGAESGDTIYFERVLHMEGEEPEEPVWERLTVGTTVPDIDRGVLGQMPGETREFSVRFPDDFHNARLAGRAGTIRVKLHTITRRRLPEVTDDWIRQVNAGESLEDFRQKERRRLQSLLDDAATDAAVGEAITKLVNASTVEYPAVLLDEEVEATMERLGAELREQGLTYKQYLEAAGLTAEQHESLLAKEADERIRTRLVLREFADQHQIRLTDDEIRVATEVSSRLQLAGSSDGAAAPGARTIMNRMLYRKIGAHLLELVQVVPEASGKQEE